MKILSILLCLSLCGCVTAPHQNRISIWLQNEKAEIDQAYTEGKITKAEQLSLKMQAVNTANSIVRQSIPRPNVLASVLTGVGNSMSSTRTQQVEMRDNNGNQYYGTIH